MVQPVSAFRTKPRGSFFRKPDDATDTSYWHLGSLRAWLFVSVRSLYIALPWRVVATCEQFVTAFDNDFTRFKRARLACPASTIERLYALRGLFIFTASDMGSF